MNPLPTIEEDRIRRLVRLEFAVARLEAAESARKDQIAQMPGRGPLWWFVWALGALTVIRYGCAIFLLLMGAGTSS